MMNDPASLAVVGVLILIAAGLQLARASSVEGESLAMAGFLAGICTAWAGIGWCAVRFVVSL